MTEYDLFVLCLPTISEIVVWCRRLDRESYEAWKHETMEHAPDMVKEFMGKVMLVIDKYVWENER